MFNCWTQDDPCSVFNMLASKFHIKLLYVSNYLKVFFQSDIFHFLQMNMKLWTNIILHNETLSRRNKKKNTFWSYRRPLNIQVVGANSNKEMREHFAKTTICSLPWSSTLQAFQHAGNRSQTLLFIFRASDFKIIIVSAVRQHFHNINCSVNYLFL